MTRLNAIIIAICVIAFFASCLVFGSTVTAQATVGLAFFGLIIGFFVVQPMIFYFKKA